MAILLTQNYLQAMNNYRSLNLAAVFYRSRVLFWDWGAHPVLLRVCYWLCIQGTICDAGE